MMINAKQMLPIMEASALLNAKLLIFAFYDDIIKIPNAKGGYFCVFIVTAINISS